MIRTVDRSQERTSVGPSVLSSVRDQTRSMKSCWNLWVLAIPRWKSRIAKPIKSATRSRNFISRLSEVRAAQREREAHRIELANQCWCHESWIDQGSVRSDAHRESQRYQHREFDVAPRVACFAISRYEGHSHHCTFQLTPAENTRDRSRGGANCRARTEADRTC